MLYLPTASTGPVARAGAAIGDSDGATIGLAKCDPNGNFSFTNLPHADKAKVLNDKKNEPSLIDPQAGSSWWSREGGAIAAECNPRGG